MDFNERVIPGVSANFLYQEAYARYEFARKFLKKGMKVLDVGCGTGYGSAVVGQKASVIGIDNDKEAIDYAQKKFGQKSKFLLANAEKLEFGNGEFDLVCAFEVIEHLRKPKKFLSEARRVLKNQGILVISTPNKLIHSPKGEIVSPYHLREYSLEEVRWLLNQFFSKLKIFGQGKSKKAKRAIEEFMKSQKARQSFVEKDKLGLRRLFSKKHKEKAWKYLGSFFGRSLQEFLNTSDFQIKKYNLDSCEYFVAVCRK